MTYLKTEKLADYTLGQKIYERQDGSSLYFAKSKKGKEFIIRVRKDDGKTLKSIFSNEMQLTLMDSLQITVLDVLLSMEMDLIMMEEVKVS